MKTIKELNHDILKITMEIMEKSPELSKYLEEMPEVDDLQNKSHHLKAKRLNDYYNSLKQLLKKYTSNT